MNDTMQALHDSTARLRRIAERLDPALTRRTVEGAEIGKLRRVFPDF